MKNPSPCFGPLALATLALIGIDRAAGATDAIFLPCATFSSGNSWRYSEKAEHGSTVSTSTVSFVQGDQISINERKTISPRIHGDGRSPLPDADQLVRKKLSRSGNTVYLTSYTMELKAAATLESRTVLGPGEGAAECGDLPATAQYDQTTFLNGRTTRERVKVVTTLVGPARSVVPAGAFDTIAVRRNYTITHVSGFSGPRPPTLRIEMLIYSAESVGVVRTETTTEQPDIRTSATTELLSYQLK
jgi:hypothetical protein